MEDVGILFGHAVYFTAIRHVLWSIGIFCGNLVSFSRFGKVCQEKSGNPPAINTAASNKKIASDSPTTKSVTFMTSFDASKEIF
jgi:hypothetical protein